MPLSACLADESERLVLKSFQFRQRSEYGQDKHFDMAMVKTSLFFMIGNNEMKTIHMKHCHPSNEKQPIKPAVGVH